MSSPCKSRSTRASRSNGLETTPKKSPKRKTRSGGVAATVSEEAISRNNEILFYYFD